MWNALHVLTKQSLDMHSGYSSYSTLGPLEIPVSEIIHYPYLQKTNVHHSTLLLPRRPFHKVGALKFVDRRF